jgi:hypothetical protein
MSTIAARYLAVAFAALGCLAPAVHATTAGPARSRTDSIIVHAISGPLQNCPHGRLEFSGAPGDALRWKAFFDRHPFLGIHYVIDRDGHVEASTPEGRRANHALGNSETSIGIELVHNGDGVEPFGRAQIDALVGLLRDLRARHNVAIDAIKGHADVDTRTFTCGGRIYKGRMDPGENFPWAEVRAALANPPRLVTGPVPVTRAGLAAGRSGPGRQPPR